MVSINSTVGPPKRVLIAGGLARFSTQGQVFCQADRNKHRFDSTATLNDSMFNEQNRSVSNSRSKPLYSTISDGGARSQEEQHHTNTQVLHPGTCFKEAAGMVIYTSKQSSPELTNQILCLHLMSEDLRRAQHCALYTISPSSTIEPIREQRAIFGVTQSLLFPQHWGWRNLVSQIIGLRRKYYHHLVLQPNGGGSSCSTAMFFMSAAVLLLLSNTWSYYWELDKSIKGHTVHSHMHSRWGNVGLLGCGAETEATQTRVHANPT